MSFKDRVIVITGAASGIGNAICEKFFDEDCVINMIDINGDSLKQVINNVKKIKAKVKTYQTDIADKDGVAKTFSDIIKTHGKIDVLINSAGISIPGAFGDLPLEDFKKVVDVNFYGTYYCMHNALQIMKKNNFGRIVNVSSTAGKVGARFISPYVASKHAVCGLTKACALEYAEYNVIVNAICPGMTETEMTKNAKDEWGKMFNVDGEILYDKLKADIPIKRFLNPVEVAELAVFLVRPEQKAITGQSIIIDGGKYTF